MITDIAGHIGRFIILILAQVLILNSIQLSGFINPFIYVLFILTLPVKISRILLLTIAFITGLAIDFFTNTPGLHAAATVCMAFFRPYILTSIAPRDGYEVDEKPSINKLGLNWFLSYSTIMVLIHHFALFYLEVFRFEDFFATLLRVFVSAIFTLVFIILSQYLFNKQVAFK